MEPLKVWMGVCKYYGPSIWSVAEKYREYAPEERVEWVDDWLDADVVIDHLIGTPDRTNLVHPLERSFSEDVKARLEMAKLKVVKTAYVMHCAIVPDQFYSEALLSSIVSTGFLDIDTVMPDKVVPHKGGTLNLHRRAERSKWLRVAWGVEPSDFLLPERKSDPEYFIYTWGASQDPEEEYIKTIYEAVKLAGGKMLHSGLDYKFDDGKHYVYVEPAKTKAEIAQRYNSCWFANAMRQEDGFELANVEAPLSNAWPITLDKPCYRHFFRDLSFLVDDDENLKDSLVEIFSRNWNMDSPLWNAAFKEEDRLWHPITPEHKRRVLEKFNWRDAVEPFWERVLEGVK